MSRLKDAVSRMRESVDFADHRGAFIDFSTNKPLRGVSKACHRVYYPNFKLAKRRRGVEGSSTQEGARGRGAEDPCSHAHVVGATRGSIVDLEVQKVVLLGPKRAQMERMHPYTRKLVRAISKIGLKMVVCQVPVFDLDRGIATAVDLVCEDRGSRTLYLIEIKCGYNGNTYTDHNAQMRHELKDVSNSPRHQHQVQAAVTHSLFKSCYSARGMSYASVQTLIARVTDEGTHFEPLRPWIKRHVPSIMDRIANFASK